jgi:hypothetical protein
MADSQNAPSESSSSSSGGESGSQSGGGSAPVYGNASDILNDDAKRDNVPTLAEAVVTYYQGIPTGTVSDLIDDQGSYRRNERWNRNHVGS